MMSCIHILSTDLRNKIAAGEVVERPASVVKELIENAIDAGATKISVAVVRAGRRLIAVTDNGSGMDREDALRCLERFGTSKISNEQDLARITTLGFRGEALSSISAVAKVTVTTGTGQGLGTCVSVMGGTVTEVRDSATIGTTVEVRDLFYNTPARRKFLKSNATESFHLVDTVVRTSLGHCQIAFTLTVDGAETLRWPAASSIEERLRQVFGKEFADQLQEARLDLGQMAVSLFLGSATLSRNNRTHQYLFINGRPARDQAVSFAVYKALEGILPRDRHPAFLIFLQIESSLVDFNVHPTKREVRFADKAAVFNLVHEAACRALGPWDKKAGGDVALVEAGDAVTTDSWPDKPLPANGEVHPFPTYLEEPIFSHSESLPSLHLGDTLIALPWKGGLAIIDYHAAHERINYERFLKRVEGDCHDLLFPQQVQLPVQDYGTIVTNAPLLRQLGLEVDDFGLGTVIVRSLPFSLRDADLPALLGDIAQAIVARDGSRVVSSAGDLDPLETKKLAVAARLACHGSLRGREVPAGYRFSELLQDLERTAQPDQCPHGRPTRVFISQAELRKMFKK